MEVFAVTEELSIDSEKVTEMVEPIETDDAESDGEVELTVGGGVSVVVVLSLVVVSSSVVVLSLVIDAPSSLLLLQEMIVRLKKKKGEDYEYMSHKVSYKWFRRTQYITSIGRNYNNVGIFTWRVSDL